MALPNMAYTFDRDRMPTPLQHLIDDHGLGPDTTREPAYDEWVRLVNKVQDDTEAQTQKAQLMATNYSIHFHAWGQAEMLELLSALQRRYAQPFEVEAIVKRDYEMICILRKCA